MSVPQLSQRPAPRPAPLPGLGPLVPGLVVVAVVVASAFLLGSVVPSLSPLIWSMVLGVALGPAVGRRAALTPGVRVAARHLLRAGVVLLGLRISLDAVRALGMSGLVVAMGTVAVTMVVTIRLGPRLGVPRGLALLIAAGSSICGASAVAAMNSVAQADEEDVAYAIGTVTVFGTLAMLLLPLVGVHALDLGDERTGLWAGASIHEVAQVAGAGAALSVTALKLATLMKLTRVVLLAPAVATVAALRGSGEGRRRLEVPGFVLAFLALILVRAAVPVPEAVLHPAAQTSTALLAAGLGALGLGIRLDAVRRAGLRPLALALVSWLVAAAVSLSLLLLLDVG